MSWQWPCITVQRSGGNYCVENQSWRFLFYRYSVSGVWVILSVLWIAGSLVSDRIRCVVAGDLFYKFWRLNGWRIHSTFNTAYELTRRVHAIVIWIDAITKNGFGLNGSLSRQSFAPLINSFCYFIDRIIYVICTSSQPRLLKVMLNWLLIFCPFPVLSFFKFIELRFLWSQFLLLLLGYI